MDYPTDLGGCIDLLYTLRAERLALSKQETDKKTEEAKLRQHIINALKENSLEGGKGATATVSLTYDIVPSPKDWDAIWDFVESENAHDLVQKRLSATACRERWNSGVEIPGIEKFVNVDLSLTKAATRR